MALKGGRNQLSGINAASAIAINRLKKPWRAAARNIGAAIAAT